MLLSAVIQLDSARPGFVPRDQGRAVQAWFMRQIERYDPALSAALHAHDGSKPYTCSSLNGFRPARRPDSLELRLGEPGWIRITTFHEILSALLWDRILPELPEVLALGDATLRIHWATVDRERHPWANHISPRTLLESHLSAPGDPQRHFGLRLASPTTFKQRERHMAVPLPELMIVGWLRRWNDHCGIQLPEDMVDYVAQNVVLSRFQLQTEAVRFGQAVTIGCVGTCTYHVLDGDPYRLRLLQALADFSFYCGTGHRTTRGMGQTQPQ
ncbi:MAG: CRISPR system precrRNA processing endoribonuclease RAMP protein Cas6 [Anaerolineae bacterium]|nr:CRISPR system precrRNA processing endoribonuclease RAMP protein Cas6 [Anaerolineae bacterium]